MWRVFKKKRKALVRSGTVCIVSELIGKKESEKMTRKHFIVLQGDSK